MPDRVLFVRLAMLLLVGMLVGCVSAQSAAMVAIEGQETADDTPEATEIDAPTENTEEPPREELPTEASPVQEEDLPATATETAADNPEAPPQTPTPWQEMPVVPVVSETTVEIYQRGLELGNDPRAFSVVGDCQNVTAYFLEDFAHPGQYDLGEYQYLQEAIDYFYDSFARERAAVRGGYNVAAVLSPLWADPETCEERESPLECEFRLNSPSIVIISMETWWYDRPASSYANYMRQIVEFSIEHGVVPILATKADNLEGDNSINAAIVQVAQEYDVPLWNFWLAVKPLPGHGLTEDAFHLRYARPFFNMPENMQHGWPVRNLTALQALDAVWRGVTRQPYPTPTP